MSFEEPIIIFTVILNFNLLININFISVNYFCSEFLKILQKTISNLSFFFFGLKTSTGDRGNDENIQPLLKVLKNGLNPRIRSFSITLQRHINYFNDFSNFKVI